jgi:CheY-like chemotaxis protein
MRLPRDGTRGKRGRTVLLVEDDAEVRDTLEDELESGGYDVVPAANGKQALDYLKLNRPERADAVILDLMMPMVSGWQMQADPQLSQIPVIVLSAMTLERPDGHGGVKRGPVNVRRFIPKPFSLKTIFEALAGCIGVPDSSPAP